MKRFLRLPSPAMMVALLALFAALAGTSYAAVTITGKNVKNSSLTGSDVKNGSLTGTDVKSRSLSGSDVKDGALAARDKGDKGDSGRTRWALVNAAGQIEAQSGGFEVESGYEANPPGAAGNVYIDSGEDLSNKGVVATIALQNQVDQNGDTITSGRAPGADSNPEFSGEISSTRCAIPGVVSCGPPGTNTNQHFVVSPRNSDGTVTSDGTRKRFYVVITD